MFLSPFLCPAKQIWRQNQVLNELKAVSCLIIRGTTCFPVSSNSVHKQQVAVFLYHCLRVSLLGWTSKPPLWCCFPKPRSSCLWNAQPIKMILKGSTTVITIISQKLMPHTTACGCCRKQRHGTFLPDRHGYCPNPARGNYSPNQVWGLREPITANKIKT